MRQFDLIAYSCKARMMISLGILVSLVVTIGTTARGDVPIAELTKWPIVVVAEPAPAEQYAAVQLKELLARATGSEMTIVTQSNMQNPGIFVGKAVNLQSVDLGEEVFRIKITNHRIDIAGGSPRGTLYGVYTFLEDEFGVRFLTPDDTQVPSASPGKSLKNADRVLRPRFAWRWSYYGSNAAHPEFASRLRNNAVTDRIELGGRSSWSLISHSVHQYVPVARFGKEHPEYFSLVDGKRRGFMKDDQFEQGGTQPCFTNPDVRRLIKEGILERLARTGQTSGNIAISQNDNTKYCRCDRCREIDERKESHMGALLTLVNEVGEVVRREHSGIFVGTLAYQFSRTPPRFLRPGPNVAIQLCSIEACQIHPLSDPMCPKNITFCKDLEGWGKICNNIYVWNYNTNFACYNAPCPNLDVIGPNVRFLAAHGVKGVFMQAAGNAQNTELCELRNYLISRLLWDPALDDRKIIEEFVTLYYGRAASKVRAYLSLIGETARQSGIHQGCFGSAAGYGINLVVAKRAIALLEEGINAAESTEIRKRVEKVLIGPKTVLIEPLARWVRSHNHQIASTPGLKAPVEAYAGIETELRDVFRLYGKHKVDRFAEWVSTQQVRATLPDRLFAGS